VLSKRLLSIRPSHFLPALPAPDLKECARASIGAFAGIGLCALAALLMPGPLAPQLYLVAPLGATAVLVFCVPNSPLAQPWSAVIGNTVSGLIAVLAVSTLPAEWAPSLAVAGAILLMFLTRSLHPPGGAVALLAALERESVLEAGFMFALMPIGVMTTCLVSVAIVFNRVTGRFYPFRQSQADASKQAQARLGLTDTELAALLKRFNQSPNIGVADLARMLASAEEEATSHRFDSIQCSEVMTTPLIMVASDQPLDQIVNLFRKQTIKSVPVVTEDHHLVGSISQTDIIDALVSRHPLRRAKREKVLASDIMQAAPTCVPANTPVGVVANKFARNDTQTVLVSEGSKVVGVLSRSDIIELLLLGATECHKKDKI
jgi:CBS domain-containing membrane protein